MKLYKITFKDTGEYVNTVGAEGWDELDARRAVAESLSRGENAPVIYADDLIAEEVLA